MREQNTGNKKGRQWRKGIECGDEWECWTDVGLRKVMLKSYEILHWLPASHRSTGSPNKKPYVRFVSPPQNFWLGVSCRLPNSAVSCSQLLKRIQCYGSVAEDTTYFDHRPRRHQVDCDWKVFLVPEDYMYFVDGNMTTVSTSCELCELQQRLVQQDKAIQLGVVAYAFNTCTWKADADECLWCLVSQ